MFGAFLLLPSLDYFPLSPFPLFFLGHAYYTSLQSRHQSPFPLHINPAPCTSPFILPLEREERQK